MSKLTLQKPSTPTTNISKNQTTKIIRQPPAKEIVIAQALVHAKNDDQDLEDINPFSAPLTWRLKKSSMPEEIKASLKNRQIDEYHSVELPRISV